MPKKKPLRVNWKKTAQDLFERVGRLEKQRDAYGEQITGLEHTNDELRERIARLEHEKASWAQNVTRAQAQEQEWRTAFDCERSHRKHAEKIAQAAEAKFAELTAATGIVMRGRF